MNSWKFANAVTLVLGKIQSGAGKPDDVASVGETLEKSEVFAIQPSRVLLDEKSIVLNVGVDQDDNVAVILTRVWNRDRWLNLLMKLAGVVVFTAATHAGEWF